MNKNDKYQEALVDIKCDAYNFIENNYDGMFSIIYKKQFKLLQELVDENKQLTLEECIKEWEERGWKLLKIDHSPIFGKSYQFKSRRKNGNYKIIEFRSDEQKFTCKSDLGFHTYLTIEELELATKTLKSMEVTKND